MMKRLFQILLLLFIAISVVTACDGSESHSNKNDSPLRYRMAYRVMDDGWVYVFDNQYVEGEFDFSSQSDKVFPFGFRGINLRYRYSDEFTETVETKKDDGTIESQTVYKSTLLLGQSNSQIERNDLNKIAEYLGYERDGSYYTTSELLALTPSELDFSYIDANMFVDLLQECLGADPIDRGGYINIPSYALFTEPAYLDDYKFQVGLIGGFGTVEVILFDVLYRTGDGLTDYDQLYDLVKNGEASEEQIQLLNTLQEIERGIVENNDLQYAVSERGDAVIAGVSFERLYAMLENIMNGNYAQYIVQSQ